MRQVVTGFETRVARLPAAVVERGGSISIRAPTPPAASPPSAIADLSRAEGRGPRLMNRTSLNLAERSSSTILRGTQNSLPVGPLTDMERRLSRGASRISCLSLVGGAESGGVVGWVGGGPAGCARRAVRLIYAGWHRRTMVRRGEPLSKIGRGQPGWGGLLIVSSRVPRALPGRHRPSRRDRRCWGWWLLDSGDRPGEPGELAGGRDGDDRAALGASLEACPGAVQPPLR